ncbi:hypothetical protein [Candidatus Ishikawella capsulata]|nr:hypothetical protein [Candidatus Ishikawaella capsulata]
MLCILPFGVMIAVIPLSVSTIKGRPSSNTHTSHLKMLPNHTSLETINKK